jgi:hypothetical protein
MDGHIVLGLGCGSLASRASASGAVHQLLAHARGDNPACRVRGALKNKMTDHLRDQAAGRAPTGRKFHPTWPSMGPTWSTWSQGHLVRWRASPTADRRQRQLLCLLPAQADGACQVRWACVRPIGRCRRCKYASPPPPPEHQNSPVLGVGVFTRVFMA